MFIQSNRQHGWFDAQRGEIVSVDTTSRVDSVDSMFHHACLHSPPFSLSHDSCHTPSPTHLLRQPFLFLAHHTRLHDLTLRRPLLGPRHFRLPVQPSRLLSFLLLQLMRTPTSCGVCACVCACVYVCVNVCVMCVSQLCTWSVPFYLLCLFQTICACGVFELSVLRGICSHLGLARATYIYIIYMWCFLQGSDQMYDQLRRIYWPEPHIYIWYFLQGSDQMYGQL